MMTSSVLISVIIMALQASLTLPPPAAPAWLPKGRIYYHVAIKDVPARKVTHYCTTGVVEMVRKERDGDYHVRLRDGQYTLVTEIIPTMPLLRPVKGTRIRSCGIKRYDERHRWFEQHPVEWWEQLHES